MIYCLYCGDRLDTEAETVVRPRPLKQRPTLAELKTRKRNAWAAFIAALLCIPGLIVMAVFITAAIMSNSRRGSEMPPATNMAITNTMNAARNGQTPTPEPTRVVRPEPSEPAVARTPPPVNVDRVRGDIMERERRERERANQAVANAMRRSPMAANRATANAIRAANRP